MDSDSANNQVYVAVGAIATELRAKVDISPGDVLLHEPAFAFSREDDEDESEDDDALPSIVQVAMNALEKMEREENESVPSTSIATARATTNSCGSRQWKDLMTEHDDDDDDVQKNALFAWGAQQIRSRLTQTNSALAAKIKDSDAVEAIRRVSLNAFAVKSKRIDPLIGSLDTNFDLVGAVMQIGEGMPSSGNGVYLLASAANHSCAPNTFVTFDGANNITFRATEFIKAHEAVTISYGPVVGVDGNVHERRSEILASRAHNFVCQCAACLTEEEREETAANDSDAKASNFIERFITSGHCTAEVALLQSKRAAATDDVVQSRLFGKAMSDTSIQSIAYDIEIAVKFQELALASLELRCAAAAPMREDTVAIAYEIVTLCLLLLFKTNSDSEEQDSTSSIIHAGKAVERARAILSRYYGQDYYPYKHILDAFVSSVGRKE